MRARFSYDLEKDFDNYKDAFLEYNYPKYGGKRPDLGSVIWPPLMREILEANDQKKEEIVRKCLTEFGKEEKKLIEGNIRALEEIWAEKEGRFIQRMEKYFGSTFNVPHYDVYLTSLGIAPFSWQDQWFMVRLLAGLPEQVGDICHELLHLYFMNSFQIYLAQNGLTHEQILNINEAITVLLNCEFSDYIILPEKNEKNSTYELQNEIVRMYRENKDFPGILDRLIEMQKNS